MEDTDLSTCGVCGLFCRACSLYIGSTESPERLVSFACRSGKSLDEVRCHGCRTEVLSWHCRSCQLKACAESSGVAFCADCSQFPCAEFREFTAGSLTDPLVAGNKPHRYEVMADCRALQERGWQTWSAEKVADYSCPSCSTLNSAYDVKCRGCGAEPSSPFVERHKQAIVRFLTNRS